MKKVTSTDVAKLAGVSQTTVSLILNDSPKNTFSASTRDRVHKAAAQLGYKFTKRNADRPEMPGKRTLLLLIPTIMNEYYSGLIGMLEEQARELNYSVYVCNTFRRPELEKEYLSGFAASSASGIIYTFLPGHPQTVERISRKIPTVIIGEKQPNLHIFSVELSNIDAGAMLAGHLIGKGHRRIAFISTPLNQLSLARSQRLEGIRKQMEKSGIGGGLCVLSPDSPTEIDRREDGLPYEYSVGRVLTARLLRRDAGVTALVGVNDLTALGIMNELAACGKRVPEDYSVCGFDNIFSSQVTSPGLTTIDHHLRLRCQTAIEYLVSRIEPGVHEGRFMSRIEYTPKLVVRGSTGPARIIGAV